MGYRAANTGYGSKPRAWCDECGSDISLHRAVIMPRKPRGHRMTRAEMLRGVIPRPAGTALCAMCEHTQAVIAADIEKHGEDSVAYHLKAMS